MLHAQVFRWGERAASLSKLCDWLFNPGHIKSSLLQLTIER